MAEVIRGAGLLDSARDFERWLAAIEAQRPISHPMPLDRNEMYRQWLYQRGQPPPPYQAAQWPKALREASAVSPNVGSAGSVQPRPPAGFASPTLQPPAEPFASRMTGPPSRNIVDERTPITADDVTNWLRNPYDANDQYWK